MEVYGNWCGGWVSCLSFAVILNCICYPLLICCRRFLNGTTAPRTRRTQRPSRYWTAVQQRAMQQWSFGMPS
ncbi:hypothetical protein BJ165DRAFT_1496979 [Panaeolus papilionaceus]|nr:hypothetical protein BJ165DRAFT_1496979 [Panaeolus papilionaceus]